MHVTTKTAQARRVLSSQLSTRGRSCLSSNRMQKHQDEKLRLLHEYQKEWDIKYKELLDKEKKLNAKFLEEATLTKDWRKSQELFEERRMQTLDFNRLKKEKADQYNTLKNLSDATQLVAESDIKNMLCKSEEICLYVEQSQKAEDFLQKVIDFHESVQQSVTEYQECKEILRDKSELMSSTVQALSHLVNLEEDEELNKLPAAASQQTLPLNLSTGAHETLEELMRKYNVSSEQLDCEIEEGDVPYLAGHFANVELYLSILGLNAREQTDVRLLVPQGSRIAMTRCLLLWRRRNPSQATLRALLEILLRLGKEEIASNICNYYCPRSKQEQQHEPPPAAISPTVRHALGLLQCPDEWEKECSGLLKTEEDMERKVRSGLMTVEKLIDEGEYLCAKWEELTMNVLNDVKKAKRIKIHSKLRDEYERIYDRCLQKQEQFKTKLNERRLGNEKLRLLHEYQKEWDIKYKELLDKEKKLNAKFLEEATLTKDWRKSQELFEERRMQTLDFNRLKKEKADQYNTLKNLSDVTQLVAERDIQNMLCKSEEIDLYAEHSQKAEDFLQKIKEYQQSVQQSVTEYQECKEILRDKSELMSSTVQALSHLVNDNMLEDQIKESQSIRVEHATKLDETEKPLEQAVKRKEKSQEVIQNARKEVNSLQMAFKTQLTEFKTVKNRIRLVTANVKQKHQEYINEEETLKKFLAGLVGAAGGSAVVAGAVVGGPVGAVTAGLGATAIRALQGWWYRRDREEAEEKLQEVDRLRNVCETGIQYF